MLRWFRGDLHLHTVLSPCSELSMGPRDIVRQALAQGLDFIAVTDHNSAENCAAVLQAASHTALKVFPGVEVSTREEIHMIALFPGLTEVNAFQEYLYDHLQEGVNDPSLWGPQLVVDSEENILAECPRLLGLPLTVGYQRVMAEVVDRGGLIYPAHIDRRANSMVRTLGFLPADLPFKTVELSRRSDPVEALRRYSGSGLTLLTASDAHEIGQIGTAATWFHLQAVTFAELLLAVQAAEGREIALLPPAAAEPAPPLRQESSD